MSAGHLLFLVTEDWAFWLHRRAMAKAALAAGFTVSVACRVGVHRQAIEGLGVRVVPLPWNRQGVNPLTEIKLLWQVMRVLRREKPTLVHAVALKPVVHGALAALLTPALPVVCSVEGLGYVFANHSLKARLLRPVIATAIRCLVNRSGRRLVIQNTDDRAFFIGKGLVEEEKVVLVPGIGVDLDAFPPAPEPEGVCVFVYVGRMLQEKGIAVLVDAARLLRQRGVAHRVRLVGAPDPGNPASLTEETLQAWHQEGIVEWTGPQSDIGRVWAMAHVVVLPTVYREGMPTVLLEAGACGRPAIVSDTPGCRDFVLPGTTGLVVPPSDAPALANAMQALAENPALRQKFGQAARQRVVEGYAAPVIGDAILRVYRSLHPHRQGAAAP